MWTPEWSQPLSSTKLCPTATCGADDYMVNSAAISNDGTRIVAVTYYQFYSGLQRYDVDGVFGIYIYDDTGTRLHAFEYAGDKGIYHVAISGDGSVAAGGKARIMSRRARRRHARHASALASPRPGMLECGNGSGAAARP